MTQKRNLFLYQKYFPNVIGLVLIYLTAICIIGQEPINNPSGSQLKEDLRLVPGKVLVQGQNNIPTGPLGLLTYRLEQVALREVIEISQFGQKKTPRYGDKAHSNGQINLGCKRDLVDDARLTGVWSHGPGEIGVLIYNPSILKDGAVISVQDSRDIYSLPEPLKLPATLKAAFRSAAAEKGNEIVSIHSALRIIGSVRQPLVQIELRTNRPFPVRNAALEVQIGKQFFVNELGSDDTSGHSITVSLSPEVFAALKDGAEVLAGFSFDRSGARSEEVWYFGRLNKRMLDR